MGPRVLILFAQKRTRVNLVFAENQSIKMCHITLALFNLWLAHVIVRSPRQCWRHHVPRVTHPVLTRVTSELVKLCAKKSKTVWHMASPGATTCPIRTCHVSTVRPATWQYGLPSQHQIFACLARRTDRDNFSIRTPFVKINIPPESGEWDGHNDTIFVAFQALWKLSKF